MFSAQHRFGVAYATPSHHTKENRYEMPPDSFQVFRIEFGERPLLKTNKIDNRNKQNTK